MQRFKTLPTGGDLILGEVVSNYLSPSFLPGHYSVTAHLKMAGKSITSEVMELIVEAPKTDQLENIQCAWMGCNITAFIHQSDAPRIYLRESNGAMLNGSFSRIDRAARVKVSSLSSSIHLAPRIDGRWSAWIEGGALFYAPLWGQVGRASGSGMTIPLTHPQLLQPGFQGDEEQAMFLILGQRDGHLAMLTATVSESGVTIGAIASDREWSL
ncbi:MAG: hypothetical protein L3J28_04610 [Candidatus Polarisedimenticolaceae bacterium]|nr:hypothetical protein [Candidatus Polarisedimenticolaceae bacterium]